MGLSHFTSAGPSRVARHDGVVLGIMSGALAAGVQVRDGSWYFWMVGC